MRIVIIEVGNNGRKPTTSDNKKKKEAEQTYMYVCVIQGMILIISRDAHFNMTIEKKMKPHTHIDTF